jgi:PPOX class probable F420-dependent enzyme
MQTITGSVQVSDPQADRPEMPEEYGILAQHGGSGLRSWQDVTQQLARARNYWVATARPDGRPHVMPVWGIWLDGAFWFSTSRRSRKGRNLAAEPHLAVHLESGDDVVILEGEAEEVTEEEQLVRFADTYETKYGFRPDTQVANTVTYRLRPRVAFAWLESDFPGGATRWRFA